MRMAWEYCSGSYWKPLFDTVVPSAPAVIPAPRAYVEVVEIKTLVVRMLSYLANTDRNGKKLFSFNCH